MQYNPITNTDSYKLGHPKMFPEGTEGIYSNFTARGSRIENVGDVLFFGLQAFLKDLQETWNAEFFSKPKEFVAEHYARRVGMNLGPDNNVGTAHFEALHDLGYLPLEFCALPEGTLVPLRVPMFTVENTHPQFFWLVNYLETSLSAEIWQPITSATLAYRMREMLDRWAEKTSSAPEFVDFQAHDFSFRGMAGVHAAAKSGAGHLLSFAGTDTIPALDFIERYYMPESELLGMSVPATEHSVMSAGGPVGEQETFDRLLELYPTGIVSVVSDTWDLWHVITKILPNLKRKIMGRDGKLVIRPDSGDPVDILCGTEWERVDGEVDLTLPGARAYTPAEKGVIELLWDEFGGTVNSKGYKELDPHVGAIYGDSITYERADEICRRLEVKGFASTNVVLGVGSYTYQYVTRDTFGMAMKATWAKVNGAGRNLFKDPVTDSGLKRSAKGRLAVFDGPDGLFLINEATPEDEFSVLNELQPVWRNGSFTPTGFQTWDEIVERVGKRVLR